MQPDSKIIESKDNNKPHWTKGSGCLFLLIGTVASFCSMIAPTMREMAKPGSASGLLLIMAFFFYGGISFAIGCMTALWGSACIKAWSKGFKVLTLVFAACGKYFYILFHHYITTT